MIATKQQERMALEQMRKIVEGLGENSYVATAFDGVWALAERNIDEDAGYSALDWSMAVDNHYEICDQKDKSIVDLECECKRLKEGWENQRNINDDIKALNKELYAQTLKERDKIEELNMCVSALELKVSAQADELVKLKAKLYDLIIKE